MSEKSRNSPHGDILDPLIISPDGEIHLPKSAKGDVEHELAVHRAYRVFGKTGNPELLRQLGIWSD